MLRSHLPPGYDGEAGLSPGPTAGTIPGQVGPGPRGCRWPREFLFCAHTHHSFLWTLPLLHSLSICLSLLIKTC